MILPVDVVMDFVCMLNQKAFDFFFWYYTMYNESRNNIDMSMFSFILHMNIMMKSIFVLNIVGVQQFRHSLIILCFNMRSYIDYKLSFIADIQLWVTFNIYANDNIVFCIVIIVQKFHNIYWADKNCYLLRIFLNILYSAIVVYKINFKIVIIWK